MATSLKITEMSHFNENHVATTFWVAMADVRKTSEEKTDFNART
jgi:hypothetical protein